MYMYNARPTNVCTCTMLDQANVCTCTILDQTNVCTYTILDQLMYVHVQC